MELHISIIHIAKSRCNRVFQGVESIFALKIIISTIQNCNFNNDWPNSSDEKLEKVKIVEHLAFLCKK
jgi:hypothetical protein